MPKYRKMLNDWQAPYIQSLMRLIETQSKINLANWCLDYAERDSLLSEAAEECANMETAFRAVAVENEHNPAKINWNC